MQNPVFAHHLKEIFQPLYEATTDLSALDQPGAHIIYQGSHLTHAATLKMNVQRNERQFALSFARYQPQCPPLELIAIEGKYAVYGTQLFLKVMRVLGHDVLEQPDALVRVEACAKVLADNVAELLRLRKRAETTVDGAALQSLNIKTLQGAEERFFNMTSAEWNARVNPDKIVRLARIAAARPSSVRPPAPRGKNLVVDFKPRG